MSVVPDHTDTSKYQKSITIAGVFNLFLVSVRENFNKLAKTRKLGIFRKIHFGEIQFGKIHFGKIHLGKIYFGKTHIGKNTL